MKTLIFSAIVTAIACVNRVGWLACVSYTVFTVSFVDCLFAVLDGDWPELP